jgi:hypothetical protein
LQSDNYLSYNELQRSVSLAHDLPFTSLIVFNRSSV